MEKRFIIKKCEHCGALVEVLEDCNCENCGIKCCGEIMQELKPLESEEVTKHLPILEVDGDKIKVSFKHPMEEDHLIKYVWMVYDNKVLKATLTKDDEATCTFEYVKGAILYSYCNKHGLWKKAVE